MTANGFITGFSGVQNVKAAGKIRVRFVAGSGPIVRDTATSRRLYGEALGIHFKEESGGDLHTEALQGAKTFALWPLCQAAHSCFGNDSWPEDIPIPQAWLQFDVDSVENATADLVSQGFEFLSRTRRSHGAKLSHVYSLPKDYWSASLSLLRCGKKNNALCNSNMFLRPGLRMLGHVRQGNNYRLASPASAEGH